MSKDVFLTRKRASDGVKLDLKTPLGEPTEHWLLVRHVWSDEFEEANDEALATVQEAVLAAGEDKAKLAKVKRDAKYKLWASLVAGWSFDEPCTPDAVESFLREAPQIGKVLDKFAADSKAFFGHGSTSSNAGSSTSES